MSRFSSLRTINNELYRFYFSEVARLESSKYYVEVKHERVVVAAFEMKKDPYRNQWVVCQPAPAWIIQEGPTVAQIIEAALNKKARRSKPTRIGSTKNVSHESL